MSFTDDDGFEESVTSTSVYVQPASPLYGGFDADTVPDEHNGEEAFTFQVRFSEEPDLTSANVRDHVLTVTGGEVTDARQTTAGSNLRWTITVEPEGDDDVSVALPPTTNCSDNGAVCTASGKMLSNPSSITVLGPTDQPVQVQNTPATGQPTISGDLAIGETLGVSLSAVSDSNGMANAAYSYQWLQDSSPISAATAATYTVAGEDAGHNIKVEVSFTDDDGFEESVTSGPVSIPNRPLTAEFITTDDTPANHDGATSFSFRL